MAAALGSDLILEVHACRAGLDQLGRGPRNVEGAAPAGVGIDQEWQVASGGDSSHILADVVQRGYAEIGQAEGGIRYAGAGDVDRPEAGTLGEQRRIGVDRPHDLQRSLRLNGGAQAGPGGSFVRHDLL